MIRHAILPASMEPARYINIHVKYIAEILKDTGTVVEHKGHVSDEICGHCLFPVQLDDRRAVIDFHDFRTTSGYKGDYLPTFKIGCGEETNDRRNYFAFTGCSVFDWPLFREMQRRVRYKAQGVVVASHGLSCSPEAVSRRRRLMNLIGHTFGGRAHLVHCGNERYFWGLADRALVAVFVPGSANNMATRACLQYFGLGCCVVSPTLLSLLPYHKRWEPGVHYLECRPDFSDVPDLVRWCESNREAAIQIGKNAASLFEETSTPKALVQWIEECLQGVKA